MSYFDETTKERFLAHCIEPSFGVDRTFLAVLTDAYHEDELGLKPSSNEDGSPEAGEKRVYLKLSPEVAPIKVAVFPLLKNKPTLVEKAREVFEVFRKQGGAVAFDDNGNIGKRYRRQDEIGTVLTITIDFQTLEDNSVTVRDRDTMKQIRVSGENLERRVSEVLAGVKIFDSF